MVGFDSVGQLRLVKEVSYGASRDTAMCLPKETQTAHHRDGDSSSWLLTLLVIVFFHVESQVDAGWSSATAAPPPSFFQVTLVCSS